MLAISGAPDRVEPRDAGLPARRTLSWRTRIHLPIAATMLLGLLCSLTAFHFLWRWEQQLAQEQFAAAAESHFLALQQGLDEYLSKLVALHALFEASDGVTRQEFEIFAGRLLEGQQAIQNFSWVPRVTRAERAGYEQAAIVDGFANFRIRAVTADDRIVPSPEQDEYLPIYYSSVAERTSRIYGVDLRSQPVIQRRLDRARDEDDLSVVPDFILHSADGNVHGFLFSLPVYRRGLPHGTLEERRRNLLGFAHGAFLTAQAFEHIISATTTARGLDLYLFSAESSPDGAPLHVHMSRLHEARTPAASQAALAGERHATKMLTAGNARWTLVATPIRGGPLAERHDRAWLMLAAGLVITAIVVLHMLSALRDARRLLRANEEISKLAQHDSLTGLANRRVFNERLAEAFAASRRGAPSFAVLYFDLDRFKDINDTLGHPAGDLLLRQVADRVRGTVRSGDVVARFGGDEFAILQPQALDEKAANLAGRINEVLARPFVIEGNDVHITASVGIAQYSHEIAAPDEIIMQADVALYRAKEDGRNCYRFHSEALNREVRERVVLADELRHAAERNELRLYYQPQVALACGRIVGLEALLRWEHPRRGLLDPSKFIAIAERTGSIALLGQWAFEEACRQMAAWREQGIAPQLLAVNFSAIQLKASAETERFIAESVARWQIRPFEMEVELTESVLMEVTEQHSETLDRLRQLGLRIAIDDFGTGYSSLNYLTRYPLNRLKIAQDLVFRVIEDPRNATVVRAAIRLAVELGIECIAEGVETEAQAKFLIAAGCDFGQGYYFSRPVGAVRVAELLRAGTIQGGARKAPTLEMVA